MHVGEQKTKELIRGTTMPTVHMTHLFSEQRELLLLLLPFGEFLDTAATARYVLQRARRSASSGGGRSP